MRWRVCAHICNSLYCNYKVSELSYIPKFSRVQISIYAEQVAPQMQSEPYVVHHEAWSLHLPSIYVRVPVLVKSTVGGSTLHL